MTHTVEVAGRVLTKRYTSWSHDEPGREWAALTVLDSDQPDLTELQHPVVAHGDPNLANYLWDGTRVRIVDFEDAGRGDRTVELDGGPSEKRNAPRHCGSAG